MNSRPSASARITGIALIVLPLIALLLKTFSFGWMMVFIIFGPIFVMVIGYVLQVIAAAQGFLSKKGLFDAARLKRATIAAWVSLAGALVLGITMPETAVTATGGRPCRCGSAHTARTAKRCTPQPMVSPQCSRLFRRSPGSAAGSGSLSSGSARLRLAAGSSSAWRSRDPTLQMSTVCKLRALLLTHMPWANTCCACTIIWSAQR